MKIAIWHNLPSGGGKRALYDQVAGLIKRGHDVQAWCPPTANQKFLPLSTLVKETVVPLAPEPSVKSGWLAKRRQLAWATGQAMQRMEDHCRRCAEEITAQNFDILLVHPCVLFRTSPIAKFCRIPSVLYLQEPMRELYEAHPPLPWEAPVRDYRPFSFGYWNGVVREALSLHSKRVQVREERAWAGAFTQILCNSVFSREGILRAYGLDSRVCYLGVDFSKFVPSNVAKERMVVGLGNLYYNKRPLLAVEAVGAMPAETRPKLVWVGNFADQPYLARIQETARRLNVDFTHKVLIPDEELVSYLQRAAAMIYTSHLEPFGYAPLEANACGTGVVAIAEGGVRETIQPGVNGLLVANTDPQLLAVELGKFTSDLTWAGEFGENARRHVHEIWAVEKATIRLEEEIMRVARR